VCRPAHRLITQFAAACRPPSLFAAAHGPSRPARRAALQPMSSDGPQGGQLAGSSLHGVGDQTSRQLRLARALLVACIVIGLVSFLPFFAFFKLPGLIVWLGLCLYTIGTLLRF